MAGCLPVASVLGCAFPFTPRQETYGVDAYFEGRAGRAILEDVDRALTQATPMIRNSDQGNHFTSPQYLDRLTTAGVQISMDGRGRVADNIFTDRLWRSVKYEEMYLNDYAFPREARVGVTRYFHFYNFERPHQALDYQTPAKVYAGKDQAMLLSTLHEPFFVSK